MFSTGTPFQGYALQQLQDFLHTMDLDYDVGITYTCCILNDDGDIIATGSLEENVLKCIAISNEHQGQGLSATILSHLVEYAFLQNRTHLFLYTKPSNRVMFEGLNFHTIIQTDTVLFMESKRHGFQQFLTQLVEETPPHVLLPKLKIGAVVANCNPFTLGHRYLLEQALSHCDYVHLRQSLHRANGGSFCVGATGDTGFGWTHPPPYF